MGASTSNTWQGPTTPGALPEAAAVNSVPCPPPPMLYNIAPFVCVVRRGGGYGVASVADPPALGCTRHCTGTHMRGTQSFEIFGQNPPLDFLCQPCSAAGLTRHCCRMQQEEATDCDTP